MSHPHDHDHDGLELCGSAVDVHAADRSGPDAATRNTTDLRRARERARSVVRQLTEDIQNWLASAGVTTALSNPPGSQPARRVNQAITEIASERLRDDLVAWLDERHRITMGRAARAAFDKMQQALPPDANEDRFRGTDRLANGDRELLRVLRSIDAGLIYDDDDSLANEIGDDLTRQLRLGVSDGETVQELSRRVELVLTDGDADDRQEAGVSGQTKRSKAELIAHDSVVDAYATAARQRYLQNGFRYAVYDATMDTKTTDLCRRMNEYVIDMLETPYFVPPLHPYCRSDIRPILQVEDRTVLSRDDVADSFVQTIMQTKSYRPPVVDQSDYRPTALSRRYGQA